MQCIFLPAVHPYQLKKVLQPRKIRKKVIDFYIAPVV